MISTLSALFFSTPLLAWWKQSFDLIEVGFLIAARWGLCHLCLGVVHDAGPGALVGDFRKWGSSEGGQGVWRDTILQYSDEFWCRKTSPWYSYLLEVRQASAEPWDPKGDFLCARLGEPCSELANIEQAGGLLRGACRSSLLPPARAGTQQPWGRWPFIPQRAEGPETFLSFHLCLTQRELTAWHMNSCNNTALHQLTC